jgi:hypothetical protein
MMSSQVSEVSAMTEANMAPTISSVLAQLCRR